MLSKEYLKPINFGDDFQPTFCIIVDTEAKFDWSKPFSRAEASTLASKE